jgi:hypothetical protein
MPKLVEVLVATRRTEDITVKKFKSDGTALPDAKESRPYTYVKARVKRRAPRSVRAVAVNAQGKPLSDWCLLRPKSANERVFHGSLPGHGKVKVRVVYHIEFEDSKEST